MKSNILLTKLDKKIIFLFEEHMKNYTEKSLYNSVSKELSKYVNKNKYNIDEILSLCRFYHFNEVKVLLFKTKNKIFLERILEKSFPRAIVFTALCILHPSCKIKFSGFFRKAIVGVLKKNEVAFFWSKKIYNKLR